MEVYICSRLATKATEYPQGVLTSWEGDGNVTEPQRNKKYFVPAKSMPTNRCIQKRMLRQSRLFITYSLHHAITAETEGQLIMKKMADAAYELFGNDKWLSQMIVCGKKLYRAPQGGDNVSRAVWHKITEPNKKPEGDDAPQFYGDEGNTCRAHSRKLKAAPQLTGSSVCRRVWPSAIARARVYCTQPFVLRRHGLRGVSASLRGAFAQNFAKANVPTICRYNTSRYLLWRFPACPRVHPAITNTIIRTPIPGLPTTLSHRTFSAHKLRL